MSIMWSYSIDIAWHSSSTNKKWPINERNTDKNRKENCSEVNKKHIHISQLHINEVFNLPLINTENRELIFTLSSSWVPQNPAFWPAMLLMANLVHIHFGQPYNSSSFITKAGLVCWYINATPLVSFYFFFFLFASSAKWTCSTIYCCLTTNFNFTQLSSNSKINTAQWNKPNTSGSW